MQSLGVLREGYPAQLFLQKCCYCRAAVSAWQLRNIQNEVGKKPCEIRVYIQQTIVLQAWQIGRHKSVVLSYCRAAAAIIVK